MAAGPMWLVLARTYALRADLEPSHACTSGLRLLAIALSGVRVFATPRSSPP